MQEWLAYHLFEALHLHAERRLRPANLRRRNADRSRARNDSKVLEQCKVKDCHVIKLTDIRIKEYQFAWWPKRGHPKQSSQKHVPAKVFGGGLPGFREKLCENKVSKQVLVGQPRNACLGTAIHKVIPCH